jgi:Heparinase II/III N-terminus/Heparinase II/III-like protein
MLTSWLPWIVKGICNPRIATHRLRVEATGWGERALAALRLSQFSEGALLDATSAEDIDLLWDRLGARPYVAWIGGDDNAVLHRIHCPEDGERILEAAERALAHRIDILGSGDIGLGAKIDWHKDYKSGFSWRLGCARRLDYNNPGRPSDVKVPWEISRLQWLIPVGQAYVITGENRYAEAVRDILEDWIAQNPYGGSVNWACTMEVALRIIMWSWFFHVFWKSAAWQDREFRTRFLCSLFLHGRYTERYLEYSDVNGNHCTADATGLVFAGLFFEVGRAAQRWHRLGWNILQEELPHQVYPDGVDFEASVAYHRLVLELFLLAALYRRAHGLPVPVAYRERLIAMARFVMAYSRPDGTVPLWGDADDARVLPLGGQRINDHRYLLGLVGRGLDVPDLSAGFSGPRDEVFWLLGPTACADLPNTQRAQVQPDSRAFPQSGFFVLRNDRDHIFIDCGPVGLAGRGGHGHNDCLSFEAVLDDTHLITDCGAYVYTACYAERNSFRSTAYHNTPQVNCEEINRFVRPDDLWRLHNDARPEVYRWECGPHQDVFEGGHTGYCRGSANIMPIRALALDHRRHGLALFDRFQTKGMKQVELEIPLHVAVGVDVEEDGRGGLILGAGNSRFRLEWFGVGTWCLEIRKARVSPTYGVALPIWRLGWRYRGTPATSLLICLTPQESFPVDPRCWASALLGVTCGD